MKGTLVTPGTFNGDPVIFIIVPFDYRNACKDDREIVLDIAFHLGKSLELFIEKRKNYKHSADDGR